MQRNEKLITFLSFGMYFITGAACFIVGSSLTHLVKLYGMDMSVIVLMGSAYALGRVLTVGFTGKMVETKGPKAVLTAGILLVMAYLVGLAAVHNFYVGLVCAFLGGVGMGAQDTVCPLLLSMSCKDNYAGALSAGQAFFGVGSFATPFLIGIMLTVDVPFYYSYYALAIFAVAMLVCVPFVKMEGQGAAEEGGEEQVKPLYAKKQWIAYGGILIACAAYCAVTNAVGLYTSSFAESLGVSAANAAFMLTIYNVGCIAGSVAFVVILKKIKEQTVLIGNCLLAFVAIAVALVVNNVVVYFVCFAIAGFFLGVLFSVILAIATRIGYKRISVTSSYVATAGGASDILTPVITGAMVGALGIGCAYYYVLAMLVITALFGIIVKVNTSEKEI